MRTKYFIVGTPESEAKKIDQYKDLEVQENGNKISTITANISHTYEIGKEVQEKWGPNNEVFKVNNVLFRLFKV